MKNNIKIAAAGILFIALSILSINGQPAVKTGYFLTNSPYRQLLNPAFAPSRGFFTLPVVGGFNLNLQSNLKLPQFIYPGSTPDSELLTFLHSDVTPEQFLSQLDENNFVNMQQRFGILSFGGYTSKASFWSFDISARMNMNMNLPYDFFNFVKSGMASSVETIYQIDNLTFESGLMLETSFGYSRLISDNLRVGARAKLLLGGARAVGGIDRMTINLSQDEWSVYSEGVIDLYGDGVSFSTDVDGIVDGINFDGPKKLAGTGVALDLGAVWTPNKYLRLSASVIDLGRISWKSDYNSRARSSGGFTFEGLDNIGSDDENEQSVDDQLTAISDGMMEMAEFRPVNVTENMSESINPIFFAGAELDVFRDKISVGLLYGARSMPAKNIHEVTAVLSLKPFRFINIATSYSLLSSNTKNTFGVAMGLNLSIIHLYMAVDYLPVRVTPQYFPLNEMSTNIQFGFSINL